MLKRLSVYLQYITPQHCLSRWMGKLADSQNPRVKNYLIKTFLKRYHVDMREAVIQDPLQYTSFNQFFIRELKPGVRPIANDASEIASPVDGSIAQMGRIRRNQLLQAKGQYYNLETLLAGDSDLAKRFYDGSFATLYLAPHNYHRVHMPVAGKLVKTIYVPGQLFSVNRMTSALIPNLYSRNERFICLFDTAVGPMAVILVGALIVGSMQMSWMDQPIKSKQIITKTYFEGAVFEKGAELGYFKLGSTAILLYGKDAASWLFSGQSDVNIRLGQALGTLSAK